MENAIQIIVHIAIVIFSVVLHEVSHGFAALWLGDHTAEYEGRLTLNPVKHLDPFGSVLLPLMLAFANLPLIGWARPVPYNPYNLRDQKWGPAIVGVAGPAANILLAVVFGLVVRYLPLASAEGTFVFNFAGIAQTIVVLNLMLAIFNLVPIPPLDGSKVLFSVLPYQYRGIQVFLEQYGIILLLIFIFFFANILVWPVFYLFRLIVGG
ncbi:MAG: site-2 protease family protein [Candidatus Sungbacteria bacterium]|nr:site-2 protease family protein [Candidatus Sungbacteria bacterium]